MADDGRPRRRLGLIVNPIAGIGGRVGLKGSDGEAILATARLLGGISEAPARTATALRQMDALAGRVELLTWGGPMGEDIARAAGWTPVLMGAPPAERTTGMDTRLAATALAEAAVDIILFAGGDGTARDLHAVVDSRVPVLGIPAGVKIHSAAFAITPVAAGQVAAAFLEGRVPGTRDAEVMDIDEDAFRAGRVSAALYGVVRIPADQPRTQTAKAGRGQAEGADLQQIGRRIADEAAPGELLIVGPGTTTAVVKEQLGVRPTLLGVDAIRDGHLVAGDASERRLLDVLDAAPTGRSRIVISVIGGQGYIFGRGNQQISPAVIGRVGRDRVSVVATRDKIDALQGRPLLVDTGDPALDRDLAGYMRVIVGARADFVMRVQGSDDRSER